VTDEAPRVLILTAGYGAGHNAVAAALAAALGDAGARTRVVDHFRELVHPCFDRWSRSLYTALLRRAPTLWGLAYWLGDCMRPSSRLAFDVTRLGRTGLARLLAVERPDCVACTHPTPASALADLRARGGAVPPFAVVFSDFAVHRQWVHPAADLHCVPAPALVPGVVAAGADRGRVLGTGIPVRAEFEAPMDRAAARAGLGLHPARPVVLAMAGANGRLGRLPAVTRTLRALPRPLEAVVVTGSDAGLAERLRRRVAGDSRVRVVGYAENVRQLMAAADVLVTKAGGVSLAEAVAAALPIICFGSLPGHEARNERFIVTSGAALAARSETDLRCALEEVLANPRLVERLRDGLRALGRPHAARAAADQLLRLAARPKATSSAA